MPVPEPAEGEVRVRVLAAAVEAGTVRTPPISLFTLEMAGEAIDKSAGGHARGKLVVTV